MTSTPADVFDVAIVGGGPAGAAAGVTLARAGQRVVLVDKATFPRDKCCGDGLTTMALRHLEDLGLEPHSIPSWQKVDDIVVRGPRGRSISFPLPRHRGVFAAVARRHELDAAVLDLARDAGVDVRCGHRLTSASQSDDGVLLDVDGLGTVTARYAIGADGTWSPLRRALGEQLQGYRGDWHAYRQYFTDVSRQAQRDLVVFFDADLLPGYAWSFPLGDGRANVGFGIVRGEHLNGSWMNRRWVDLLERRHIADFLGPNAKPEGPRKAWPIPTRLPGPTLTAGRAFFVGDAAALGDPLTGEGIGQALASGIALAQAITAHMDSPAAVGDDYRSWVARDLAPDTRMAEWLSRALSHRKGARAALATAGLTTWTRRNFARWLFEDEPRGVVLTPRRIHHDLLRRDGAYRNEVGGRDPDRRAASDVRTAVDQSVVGLPSR